MGDQNWQGGTVLAAKIGPGGLFLAADRFFHYRPHLVKPFFLAQTIMQYKMTLHGARVDLTCIIIIRWYHITLYRKSRNVHEYLTK